MGNFFNYNGQVMPAGQEVQDRASRSCRAGDGLFETMRFHHDRIVLEDYHFDRLSGGMQALKLEMPAVENARLKDLVRELCFVNGHHPAARVRLTIFRGEQNNQSDFIIESLQLDPIYSYVDGLIIGVYPDAYKIPNTSSPFKTNYQLYSSAALYAQERSWDDCLVLNQAGNICDASIANVFWAKDGEIATPPLAEGCIAGVMRRYLLNVMQVKRFPIIEKELTIETLLNADEAFLTNMIRGIRPVASFQGRTYGNILTKRIFTELVAPLVYS
ncbi:MAG TPA: aminotransferase class IV [Chitinophagaceae bacterium]